MTEWHVYRMNSMSLADWHHYGVSHEPILDNRHVTALSQALSVVQEVAPEEPWYSDFHEYWLAVTPCALPIVAIRPRQNPFAGAFIVSPFPLPHLGNRVDKQWTVGRV